MAEHGGLRGVHGACEAEGRRRAVSRPIISRPSQPTSRQWSRAITFRDRRFLGRRPSSATGQKFAVTSHDQRKRAVHHAAATEATFPIDDLRICTLLPSATEIAYLVGLGDAVLGVTHECDFPPEAARKKRVVRSRIDAKASAGQIDRQVRSLAAAGEAVYELDAEALRDISPTLVVTQALCEVCALPYDDVISTLDALGIAPVVVALDPKGLDDVFKDIARVGSAGGAEATARKKVAELRRRAHRVAALVADLARPRVACLEWLDPLMIGGHWVPEMVQLAGGLDVLGERGAPTRRTTLEEVVEAEPDVIVLMPCGYDLERATAEARELGCLARLGQTPAGKSGKVLVVDANSYFSRSGPRLVDGLELLASLFHSAVEGTSPHLKDAARQLQ